MKKLNEKEKAIENMKNTFNGQIDEMEKILRSAKCQLSECNYIIMVGKVAVDIEVVDRKTTGKTEVDSEWSVRRYNKKTAEKLAKGVRNGNDEVGYAILWKEAVENKIKAIKDIMEYFSK